MSNSTTTFSTSVITVPAKATVSYGASGASPKNYYQSSVSMAENSSANVRISVADGWADLNNSTWNGPTWDVTNNSDVAVKVNLNVVAIGAEAKALSLEEIK